MLPVHEGIALRGRSTVAERQRDHGDRTTRSRYGGLRRFGERVRLDPKGAVQLPTTQDLYQRALADKPSGDQRGQVDRVTLNPFERTHVDRGVVAVSYTHLRAHETDSYLVCRLL